MAFCRLAQGSDWSDRRPRHRFRLSDQAHPRIQAAAPQRVAHRRAVQPAAQEPWRRVAATNVFLRWQGGASLPAGQADHQIHQQPRRRDRPRSDRARPSQGRVPPRLFRLARRAAHSGRRSLQPDLDRGLRGKRHEQHEVHDEWGADARHTRWRDDRDVRGSRRRELLPVRLDRQSGGRQPQLVQPEVALRERARDPRRIGPDLLRLLQPRRARRLRSTEGRATDARRPLHAPGRPQIVSGGGPEADCVVRRQGCLGAQGHSQRGRQRQVLQRPHDRPIRRRNLASETVSGEKDRCMTISPLAGNPAPKEMLVDVARLEREYFECRPDLDDPEQRVSFGTSGHRGSSLHGSFTETHILVITQAICDFRCMQGIDGPLFMARDTHALSGPAQHTALEVLAGNHVHTVIQQNDGVTPTPVISRAILVHNRGRSERLADGIIITPSHNPPEDGGFKYNPTHGGPADIDVTRWIEKRANDILRNRNSGVQRMGFAAALSADTTRHEDFVIPYVTDLRNVVDMDAIRVAGLRLAVDPLGGAAVHYWEPINTLYKLDITVVNPKVDPTFSFMTVDHDGKIRMDCSSPYAMARLVGLKDRFRVAFANDPDSDRHGIVTPGPGLMNPNHYLAVAIRYLLTHRDRWPTDAVVGKTLVSSSMIDRVVAKLGRRLAEVPVGFKWFAPGLLDGSCCFGGEESAGASFLRRDGTVWTTDKDGPIMNLLAAEITARTGKDPGEHYRELAAEFGAPRFTRIDAPATTEQKAQLGKMSPEAVTAATLAGEPITAKVTRAPGNDAPIGGLKVIAASGWFAARPSGTEDLYKIYAESFRDEAHLQAIVTEAQSIVSKALGGAA